jgi:hypothetical protein
MRAKEFITENFGVEVYPGVIPFGEYLGPEPEFAPPGNYRDAADLHDEVYDLIDAGVEPKVVNMDPKRLLATQDWLSNAGGDDPLFDEYTDRPVVYQKGSKFYILDGHHRSTKALKAGQPILVYLFSDQQLDENLSESFDQPYKSKWEKSDYGDVDANTKLPDGTYLNIMFNQEYDHDGEEVIQVDFHRNNSQEVTGEGDAHRIFATVLAAIQKYIKKYKSQKLIFSASKEMDPSTYYGPDDVVPNPESRAKLYNRLVQRYAGAWGYSAQSRDDGNVVRYELTRVTPVAENFADGKVKGKSRPGRVKRAGASCNGSVTDLRSKAKNTSGERAKMYHWCANMKSGKNK